MGPEASQSTSNVSYLQPNCICMYLFSNWSIITNSKTILKASMHSPEKLQGTKKVRKSFLHCTGTVLLLRQPSLTSAKFVCIRWLPTTYWEKNIAECQPPTDGQAYNIDAGLISQSLFPLKRSLGLDLMMSAFPFWKQVASLRLQNTLSKLFLINWYEKHKLSPSLMTAKTKRCT